MSFFSTVVPVIMRQEKYSLEAIGMLQLVKLPWILKFLWAPIIDKTSKNNRDLKRWIILSELFYAFVIISIGLFSLKTDFKLIVILMIVAFIASATQDIATDTFAILNLKKTERAYGNSMQSSGSFIGSLLGTGVLLIAYFYFGWTILLFLLAGFVLIAILPLYFYKNEENIQKDKSQSVKFSDIFTFFATKKTLLHLPVLLLYYSGIIGILAMLKPYLVDLGYDIKQIGFMSGIVGTAIAAISSLFAGYIIKKISVNKALISFLFISLTAVLHLIYITISTPTLTQIYVGIGLLWGSYGFATVAIYTKSMSIVRKNREGTDFTLQIVITHLSSMLIAIFSGKIGDKVGYHELFKYEAILVLITFIVVLTSIYLNKKTKNENK